jgi:putative ABC transport system permease protein
MGKLVVIGRLVRRDLRRHRVEAVLLILVVAAATAALTLALALRGVADHPYQVTRAETAGPDVVVSDLFDRVSTKQLAAVADEPGVAGHSGPFPIASATLRVGRTSVPVSAEGRDRAPTGGVLLVTATLAAIPARKDATRPTVSALLGST